MRGTLRLHRGAGPGAAAPLAPPIERERERERGREGRSKVYYVWARDATEGFR